MSHSEQVDEGRIWIHKFKSRTPSEIRVLWFPFGGGMAHTAKSIKRASTRQLGFNWN